jgi:FAD/FMN-containing dehydrogenase
MRAQRDLMMKPPPGLNVWAVVRKAPPLPFLATSVHGQEVVALAIFYSGAPADGAKIIDQIRGFGTPHGEHVGVQPFVGWQQAFDPLLTPGARNYWKSHNFSELKDEVIDAVITYAARLPSPHCEIFVGTLGGAAGDVAPEAMAYGNRDANFVINVHGRWETAAEDQAGIAWAREFFAAAEPYATGSVYVNFMTADETGRIRSAYGANYERLAQIKAKYDPANVFHINQNIRPADGAS